MKESQLSDSQKKLIEAVKEEWAKEIDKIPPAELPPGFNNAASVKAAKPYYELKEKYMKIINSIKENND